MTLVAKDKEEKKMWMEVPCLQTKKSMSTKICKTCLTEYSKLCIIQELMSKTKRRETFANNMARGATLKENLMSGSILRRRAAIDLEERTSKAQTIET